MLSIEGGRFESMFDLFAVEDGNDSAFLSFMQNAQHEKHHLVLCCVTNNDGGNLLLVQGQDAAYIIGFEQASSQKYERFFANIDFIIDTERDLGMLLKYLPIDKNKIDDLRIIRGLVSLENQTNSSQHFKIRSSIKYDSISFPYIRSVIIRGTEMLKSINNYKEVIFQHDRAGIYRSIINERYKALQIYNSGEQNALSKISDIYNVFPQKDKDIIDELYAITHNIAGQNKVPNSSVISLQALEVLALKSPTGFDDITHIFGFNKKYLHNAVIRKILHMFEAKTANLKRNKALEMALDVVLCRCAEQNHIDKNLICSKREIIAYINGNINVDFLKGWKKEVYGKHATSFTQGKSIIKCQGQQLLISNA